MTAEDKKISSIYQEASSTEPPAHLDNSILAASRDAVESKPRAKSPFSGGWPVPASIAAVVIVAVIIVPVIMPPVTDFHPSGPNTTPRGLMILTSPDRNT